MISIAVCRRVVRGVQKGAYLSCGIIFIIESYVRASCNASNCGQIATLRVPGSIVGVIMIRAAGDRGQRGRVIAVERLRQLHPARERFVIPHCDTVRLVNRRARDKRWAAVRCKKWNGDCLVRNVGFSVGVTTGVELPLLKSGQVPGIWAVIPKARLLC